MFKFIQQLVRRPQVTIIPFAKLRESGFGMEGLEDRRLLSAGHHGGFGGGHHAGSSITFNLAPAVVQTGLDTLAEKAGLADPASTATVYLNNKSGVETYTVDITGTGTDTKITVDQNGNAVTSPTRTTTTYGALSGTAAGNEFAAIVTAKSLTAPASTATVNVITSSDGSVVYSVNIAGTGRHGTVITVDATGNPVGNQSVPFSVLSSAIQAGLSSTLASTATDSVSVRTVDGVTLYSLTSTSSGTSTTTTVDITGKATSLPSTSTTTFSTLTSVVQSELQTLATADGYTGTALATLNPSVTVYTEANGAVIYAVTVSATGTNSAGASYTFDITVASDSAGNPTVPPRHGFGDRGFGSCGGGFAGIDDSGASTSTSSTSSSTATSARRRRH